jgi:hypothetical protein
MLPDVIAAYYTEKFYPVGVLIWHIFFKSGNDEHRSLAPNDLSESPFETRKRVSRWRVLGMEANGKEIYAWLKLKGVFCIRNWGIGSRGFFARRLNRNEVRVLSYLVTC